LDTGNVSQGYLRYWRYKTVIEEKKRKVRSDKKRDVKPTIHYKLHECISRLSYITNTPIKDVGETICLAGLSSKKVIECLSKEFRRGYKIENTVFIGDKNRLGGRAIKEEGFRKRITLRFPQSIHDDIGDLAYALDVTVSSATAMLLEASVKNTDIVNDYIKRYIESKLDDSRMKELKEVIRFINKNNPYDEEVTLSMIINFLFEEFMDNTRNFTKVITNWIDKVSDKKKN
jgi:hypothetical protein